jgi:hypothetical protein
MNLIRTKWSVATLGLSATLLLAGAAQASLISDTYEFAVNTTSLTGQSGYLDFEFDPGVTPFDSGSATLAGFTTDGTLTTAAPPFGDVRGSLPGTVVINNTDALNDYTPGITYGSFFDVFVTLDIPSVSGTASGGNSFTLDVEDSGFNPLLSSTFPAVEIDLDAITGNPTITNNTSGPITVTPTPEPASFALFGIGLALMSSWRRRAQGQAK